MVCLNKHQIAISIAMTTMMPIAVPALAPVGILRALRSLAKPRVSGCEDVAVSGGNPEAVFDVEYDAVNDSRSVRMCNEDERLIKSRYHRWRSASALVGCDITAFGVTSS